MYSQYTVPNPPPPNSLPDENPSVALISSSSVNSRTKPDDH